MKSLKILTGVGLLTGLLLTGYGYSLVYRLTPELIYDLYLGAAFFFLLIFRAITADNKEFNIKSNVIWSKIGLLFGYILIFFSAYVLIFNIRYPEQGFMVAFVAPISILCFVLSYRFWKKDKVLIEESPFVNFVNKVILVILSFIVVIYLYDIPKTKSYPTIKYSVLLSILFIIWTFLVLYFIIKNANRRDGD